MKTYCDLFIKASDEELDRLIRIITEKLDSNTLWSREADKENIVLSYDKIYAFKRQKDNLLPGAGLSLFPKEPNSTWYVPNVVPLEYGQLSYNEYNGLLKEFYEQHIQPACSTIGVDAEITSGDVSAEDFLGVEAANALQLFSDCANKSTGSSHPNDQELWFRFILKALDKKSIDTNLLERQLVEQGWIEEKAYKLVIEFEFARDLLRHIEKNS